MHREAKLRGVRLERDLGFGEERAPDGDAITATDESTLLVPNFEGMRVSRVA
jgi:hypothetical protein